jgi:N-acetylmuramoyl-L-alanine amidase
VRAFASLVTACFLSVGSRAQDASGRAPLVVVVDAGHGGVDEGARGPAGSLEKDLVLEIARRVGRALEAGGARAVFTRESDAFVSLAERTEIANRARADLFLSIHANSAPDRAASGSETYFLSPDASDEEALRTALAENAVFRQAGAAEDSVDVVGGILGDLIRTEHMLGSSRAAAAIQHRLAALEAPSRGVKQAPFAVLSGVNMPAVLVEVGFLTNAAEEQRLRAAPAQQALARALADAVLSLSATRAAASPEEVR